MTTFDETPVQPAKDYVREVTARYIGPRRKSLTISGPGVPRHQLRAPRDAQSTAAGIA